MRRLVPIRRALIAATALVVPASAMAGVPSYPAKPTVKVAGKTHDHRLGKSRCTKCLMEEARKKGIAIAPPPEGPFAPQGGLTVPAGEVVMPGLMPGEVVVSGPVGRGVPCEACQQGGPGGVIVGSVEAPGYARVGGEAPGRAAVGGMMAAAEPAPIGVVQAGYASGASAVPYAPPAGPAMGPGPGTLPPATGPTFPQPRHPSPVARLLGLDGFGRIGRARAARLREEHAKITYGAPGGPVSELPASLIYGRR